jgi:secondary thiamine-phosphate synthase enzyme
MTYRDTIELQTRGHRHMHDLTDRVARCVNQSGITTGLAHLFNVGSTAVIGTIEFEPGLERDLPEALDRLLPPSRAYGHEQAWHDGNGHSHLQASILGPELTVPVENRQLVLGTWQQIFHLECDVKPRTRQIIVTIQGDGPQGD